MSKRVIIKAESEQAAPTADPDRTAYLAYCAAIEPMVRLTLCGTDSQIMATCLAKAQAKRVVREMIALTDGNPDLGKIKARMKEKPAPADLDLARSMFLQVDEWRRYLLAALAAWPTDDARVHAVADGRCPGVARACMDSSWFAKRDGIASGAKRHAAEAAGPAHRRAERIKAAPAADEDLFGAQEGRNRRVAGMEGET
jgi:hypothetical protein